MPKYIRKAGYWTPYIPEVGDRVWYLGEIRELQGDLKVTGVRKELGQVSIKPVEDDDPMNGGWAVLWTDITYTKPTLPEESYLYP